MAALLDALADQGVLRNPRLRAAFQAIDRAAFLPMRVRNQAEVNVPLPVGHGQTISQPYTVAFMLEALDPEPGDRVLDVGAGSGWAAALLAWLVAPNGMVYAVERIGTLAKLAKDHLQAAGVSNALVAVRDGSQGWLEHAPFQCIHVAAAARRLPTALREQLAVGGRLIIPVGEGSHDLLFVRRISADEFIERRFPGFQFVPLIEDTSSV